MRRREFVKLLGGAAAEPVAEWSVEARAQPGGAPVRERARLDPLDTRGHACLDLTALGAESPRP
jgi:hypothetical protein